MTYELFALIACKVILMFIPAAVCFFLLERYFDRRKARNVGILRDGRRENAWRQP
jgi:hypothetical protein